MLDSKPGTKKRPRIDVVVMDFYKPEDGLPGIRNDKGKILDFTLANLYIALLRREIVKTDIRCCGLIHYDGLDKKILGTSIASHLGHHQLTNIKSSGISQQGPCFSDICSALLLDEVEMIPERLLLIEDGAQNDEGIQDILLGLKAQRYPINYCYGWDGPGKPKIRLRIIYGYLRSFFLKDPIEL